VAGQFYTADPEELRGELAGFLADAAPKERVRGVIAPHAGYLYSGAVAGEVYAAVEIPRTVVILGPNHHGLGAAAALYPPGEWLTPLGTVPVDPVLSGLVRKYAPFVTEDARAHEREHSLEVQVPFLQQLRPGLAIVPLCLGFGDYATCSLLGKALAAAIGEFGEETLIVASSDMTHYQSADTARSQDELALNEALALNAEGLLAVCRTHRITMCGVIPAVVMLVAARELGATHARLVRYATSGDITGDYRQVVAYAGVTVS
jgi:AmmeMemoRadiSam system protein B